MEQTQKPRAERSRKPVCREAPRGDPRTPQPIPAPFGPSWKIIADPLENGSRAGLTGKHEYVVIWSRSGIYSLLSPFLLITNLFSLFQTVS